MTISKYGFTLCFPFFVFTVPLIIVNSACIALLLVFGWQRDAERQNESGGTNVCQGTTTKHTHTEMSIVQRLLPLVISRVETSREKKNIKTQPAHVHIQREEELTGCWRRHDRLVSVTPKRWNENDLTPHYIIIRSSFKTLRVSSFSWCVVHDTLRGMIFYHVTNEKLGRDVNIYYVLCVSIRVFLKKFGCFINLWNVTQSILFLWFVFWGLKCKRDQCFPTILRILRNNITTVG